MIWLMFVRFCVPVLAVSSVVAARPDLVHGARGRLPVLELRTPEPVA